MADNKDNGKKGFSGLLDLASEVKGIDDPIKPEPKPIPKPVPKPSPKPSPKPEPKPAPKPSAPAQPPLPPLPPAESVSSGKKSGGSSGKWIFGILGVVFVIWLINTGGESNKKPSYSPPSPSQSYSYPKSTPTPSVQTPSTPQSAGLQYTKPSVGTNNLLSVPEIRWCIREDIRIEAMRDAIDTNAGIDEFNRTVNDYNGRCGSYRYREGTLSRAEREVEAYRTQIVSEAIREARQLGRSYQPSPPSVTSGGSASSAPKKPSAQLTRDAQLLLTSLGYDPGPVDGDYGRRTADAVKAFQRDTGITQDGWIDQDLLSVLRSVSSQRSSSPPRVESRPAQETRSSSGIPANAHIDVYGTGWICNRGFRQSGNECVEVKMPPNAHIDVYGSGWACDRGFRKVGNGCEKVDVPTNAHIDVYGSGWACDRGYQKVGDKCVSIFRQ